MKSGRPEKRKRAAATSSKPSASPRQPWYVAAFGRDYVERYRHRSDEAAAAETEFVAGALNLPRGACVLDLCCGNGRHSRALASRGLRVLGLDLSADLLKLAAAQPAAGIAYIRADMRRLPLASASLDGVVNLFTSFGYFSNDCQNAGVLREVARVLKPGAPFVMDFLNRDAVLATLIPQSERVVGAVRIRERRRYDAQRKRLTKDILIVDGAQRQKRRESVRVYSATELSALFRQAGLEVLQRCGDLRGAAYHRSRGPRLVLVARKRLPRGRRS